MPRDILIFLVLLPALSFAQFSTETRVSNLRYLETVLSKTRFSQTCPEYISASKQILSQNLDEAKSCNYNGLSVEQFNRLRKQCLRRSKLEKLCPKSDEACDELERVKEVCKRIGFTKSTRRYCARIAPLQFFFNEISAFQCMSPLSKSEDMVQMLEKRTKMLAESIRKDVGLPPPAYKLSVVEPLKGAASSVIIFLHGFGRLTSDWDSTIALARATGFTNTRFIAPQANVAFLDALQREGPSWFNIPTRDIAGPMATEEVIEAAANIANLIDIQHYVHGVAYENIAVVGFSQGAALALTVYARYHVAAAVSFSGYLPIADTYPAALSPDSAKSPVLLFHGDQDTTVPVIAGRLTDQALRAFGRNVVYTEFAGEEHGLEKTFNFARDRSLKLLKETIAH